MAGSGPDTGRDPRNLALECPECHGARVVQVDPERTPGELVNVICTDCGFSFLAPQPAPEKPAN